MSTQQKDLMKARMVGPAEIARQLGVSRSHVYRLIRTDALPGIVKLGSVYRMPEDNLARLIAVRQGEGSAMDETADIEDRLTTLEAKVDLLMDEIDALRRACGLLLAAVKGLQPTR